MEIPNLYFRGWGQSRPSNPGDKDELENTICCRRDFAFGARMLSGPQNYALVTT